MQSWRGFGAESWKPGLCGWWLCCITLNFCDRSRGGFSWFKQELWARPREQPQLRGELRLPWARRPRCDGRNVGKRGICCPTASPQRPPWSSCSGQGRKLAFSQCLCVPDRSSILAQLIPVPQAGHHPSLRKRKGKTDRSVGASRARASAGGTRAPSMAPARSCRPSVTSRAASGLSLVRACAAGGDRAKPRGRQPLALRKERRSFRASPLPGLSTSC